WHLPPRLTWQRPVRPAISKPSTLVAMVIHQTPSQLMPAPAPAQYKLATQPQTMESRLVLEPQYRRSQLDQPIHPAQPPLRAVLAMSQYRPAIMVAVQLATSPSLLELRQAVTRA